jgi:integrase
LRDIRKAGRDPAIERKTERQQEAQAREAVRVAAAKRLTIRRICDQYLEEHAIQRRQKKGSDEVARLFNVHLGELADLDPAKLTRAQAFNLLQGMISTPVVVSNLRREFGAA